MKILDATWFAHCTKCKKLFLGTSGEEFQHFCEASPHDVTHPYVAHAASVHKPEALPTLADTLPYLEQIERPYLEQIERLENEKTDAQIDQAQLDEFLVENFMDSLSYEEPTCRNVMRLLAASKNAEVEKKLGVLAEALFDVGADAKEGEDSVCQVAARVLREQHEALPKAKKKHHE